MKRIEITVSCSISLAELRSVKLQSGFVSKNGKLIMEKQAFAESEKSNQLKEEDANNVRYVPNASAFLIQFKPAMKLVVNRYQITCSSDLNEAANHDWHLQCSNNGIAWKNLDSQKAQVFLSGMDTKTFEIDNKTAYRYYRIKINGTADGNPPQLTEWTLESIVLHKHY